MSDSAWVTIAALLATSCLVRIIPAFVSIRLQPGLQRCLERVGLIALSNSLGLISTAAIGTAAYFKVLHLSAAA